MSNTQVKEVTVYRNGVFVKRRGTVELKKGKQTITIEDLPSTLDRSTVRLALSAGVTGNNIQVLVLNNEQKNERTAEIRNKISRVENMLKVRQNQIELLNRNADFTGKENINVKEVVSYISILPQYLEKVYDEIDSLNEEKKGLNKELTELNKKNNCFLLTADCDAVEDGTYVVEVRYYDHSVWWNPVYEIYTSDDDESMNVKLKAEIGQNTIENWEQVKVTLVTGNPQVSGDIPVLYPQYLNFYQKTYAARKAMMGGMKASANMAYDEEVLEETGAVEMEAPMMMAAQMYDTDNGSANVVQNDTMMEYVLEGLWDVTNDNKTNADLSNKTVACRYHTVAVPKQDDVGYLAGEVKTADIEELLQSQAAIYHKGTYMGNIYLNADLSKETYDISLGRDESVRLKREQKKRYTSNVLLKNRKKTEFGYEIKVTSSKNKPCQITLIDQIPVSQDKTITVDRENVSGGTVNENTGEVKWEFELQPTETKQLDLYYSVTWPKDKTVNM